MQRPPSATGSNLTPPYGGALPDLLVRDPSLAADVRARALRATNLVLGERALADLELLATGAYAPLRGFLGRDDTRRVLEEMRLSDGTLWPVPVTLPVPAPLDEGTVLALRDVDGELLALLRVEEAFHVDPDHEARALFGPAADEHPLQRELRSRGGHRVRGALEVVRLPGPGRYSRWQRTPGEVRAKLQSLGASRVVAFQTRNPMHRSHEWMARTAQAELDATLLVHPTVGPSLPGDVDPFTRLRAIEALVRARFDSGRTLLAALPLPMWMAGPREAVLHAIVRRNYGASHLVVGRDHAGPGRTRSGTPFFPPTAAQDAVAAHAEEIGVTPVPFGEVVYLADEDRNERVVRVPAGARTKTLSGTEVRDVLARGGRLDTWFARPEVASVLAEAGALTGHGLCVWFTGLPAAGKSTLARALAAGFETAGRRVTLLDGDVVRRLLSKGLGFSREDRDANIARIAYVAAEVVRHGGIALVAAVSPYESARAAARERIGAGRFVLVHVDTPLATCEARDGKGVYAAGRAGIAHGVTGLDDPYERPATADLVLDAASSPPQDLLGKVIERLRARDLPAPLDPAPP